MRCTNGKITHFNLQMSPTEWHEIFAGVYFCGLAIFLCFAGTNFAIRKDWFFLHPEPSIGNIFVLIEYLQQKYRFSKQ